MYKLSLAFGLSLAAAMAAPPSIGTVSAHGNVQVDGAFVYGNATIFNGTLIETEKATTNLRLNGGIDISMAPDSRGKVYSNRLVLEKGSSEVAMLSGFTVEASQFRILSTDASSKGTISVEGTNRIGVTALSGEMNVSSPSGLLLAKVTPGSPLTFDGQPTGGSEPITVTGTLIKVGGHYFVTTSAGVKYEIEGKTFDGMIGKTVTVTGTPDPNAKRDDGAAAVLIASNASVVGPAAGVATGMSTGTKLIIGGVAIAAGTGTGIGLYEANKGPASQ
jgi:hypothetical protein